MGLPTNSKFSTQLYFFLKKNQQKATTETAGAKSENLDS